MNHTEIEFKWEANEPRAFAKMQKALACLGATVGRMTDWKITDIYLDTPTQDFEKQQIAFRVRCSNEKWEATFKTRTEIKNGQAMRREETCPLPGVHRLEQALQILRQKKTWKGLVVENLVPLFTLKNRRRTQFISGQNIQAELAFDRCEIMICGRRVFFREIELELQQGAVTALELLTTRLTEKSGLTPARVSKVKTALALRQLWENKK